MGTLQVQVKPANSGNVTVKVWMAQYPPTATPIDETLIASTSSPVDKTWDLDSGQYAVTISWTDGYHNITGSTADNGIIVNGKHMYYQVLGTPGSGSSVMAMFGVNI